MKNLLSRLALMGLLVAGSGAMAQGGSVPALRVTAPNGATSLLIGSYHLPTSDLLQPAGTAFNGAKVYVIEHSEKIGPQPPPMAPAELIDGAVLARLIQTKERSRAPWVASLTPAEIARINEHWACRAPATAPRDAAASLMMFKSARRLAELAASPCAPPGMLSRDEVLQQASDAQGILTETLETEVAVEAKRRALPERIYLSALRLALSPSFDDTLHRVAKAVGAGDYDAVDRLVRSTAASPEDAATFYQTMVASRNLAWMQPLTHFLDAGDALVNVGAEHLPGPEGLINLLRARGYKVSEVVLPAR